MMLIYGIGVGEDIKYVVVCICNFQSPVKAFDIMSFDHNGMNQDYDTMYFCLLVELFPTA